MIDRAGLADFLRRRRELLRPADVGLPPGSRRRLLLTPDADLALLVLFPTEGTDTRDKLDLLRVIGTQDLRPARP